MIGLRRRTIWESILYRVWKPYRKREDRERLETIRWLVEHPAAPCVIDGHYIPNGYGYQGYPHGYPTPREWIDTLMGPR